MPLSFKAKTKITNIPTKFPTNIPTNQIKKAYLKQSLFVVLLIKFYCTTYCCAVNLFRSVVMAASADKERYNRLYKSV